MFKSLLLPPADSLNLIARDSGLIQRHSRKFSAAGILLSLLPSVTKGDTSLNHLVMHLASFVRTSMTRQAIHQRFGPASSAFLLGALHTVLAKRFPTVARDLGFFCIASLREIGRREAFWISRLPASVSLCATDGTPLDKLLKSTKGNRIDRAARLGREGLCDPTSWAIRAPGYFSESLRRDSRWLVIVRSLMISPTAFNTQTECLLSPRSRPIVVDGIVFFMAVGI